jgi:glycosyltransferase involved in cell wall biosynthesis
MTQPRRVLIYRSVLLPYSETFIVNQAESVPGYVPMYVGHRQVPGVATPAERTLVNDGRLEKARRALFVLGRDSTVNRLIRSERPVLIHAHFGQDASQVMRTARRADVPLVATFHGFDVLGEDLWRRGVSERLWVAQRERLFREAELLIAVSEFVGERLRQLGAPEHKVVRHYIGIDTDQFQVPRDEGRDPFEVLHVARLVELKGLDHLIRALAIVRRSIPEAHLCVVGSGPMYGPARQLCDELEVPARFLGAVPHTQVQAEMARAAVFSVPSHTDAYGRREALGLVFAEAQASGLPVVAYRSGGVPEVAADHDLLAIEGDVEGLAQRLELILGDPERRRTSSLAARRFVVQHHDLTTQSRKLARLYEDAL